MKWKVASETWKAWSHQVVRTGATSVLDSLDARLQQQLKGDTTPSDVPPPPITSPAVGPSQASAGGPASGGGARGPSPGVSAPEPAGVVSPAADTKASKQGASGTGIGASRELEPDPNPSSDANPVLDQERDPDVEALVPPGAGSGSFSVSLPLQRSVEVPDGDLSSFSVSLPLGGPVKVGAKEASAKPSRSGGEPGAGAGATVASATKPSDRSSAQDHDDLTDVAPGDVSVDERPHHDRPTTVSGTLDSHDERRSDLAARQADASGEFETTKSGEFDALDDESVAPPPRRGPTVRVVINRPAAAESSDSQQESLADAATHDDPSPQVAGRRGLEAPEKAEASVPALATGSPSLSAAAFDADSTASDSGGPGAPTPPAGADSVGSSRAVDAPPQSFGVAKASLPSLSPGGSAFSPPARTDSVGSEVGKASPPVQPPLDPLPPKTEQDDREIARAAETMFADDALDEDDRDEAPLFIPLLTRPREDVLAESPGVKDEPTDALVDAPAADSRPAVQSAAGAEVHGVIEIEDDASVELDTEDIEVEGDQLGSAVPAPPPLDSRPRKAWHEEVFAEHFAALVRPDPEVSAERDVDFLLECVPLRESAAVLDIGFGQGFHCFELAKRGFSVTGIDNSLAQVFRASETGDARGLSVTFLHGDMRELPTDDSFDLVMCVGTTFGYFDDDENLQTLREFKGRLRSGGRLVLQVFNRDHLVSRLPCRSWWQGLGCLVLDEAEMDYATNRLHLHRTVAFEDGRQFNHQIYIRAFMLHDLGALLERAGFRITEVSGSRETRGRFYGATSSDIWVVAEATDS